MVGQAKLANDYRRDFIERRLKTMSHVTEFVQQSSLSFLNLVVANRNGANDERPGVRRFSDLTDVLDKMFKQYFEYRVEHNLLEEVERQQHRENRTISDARKQARLLKDLPASVLERVCESASFNSLVDLKPKIMDHSTLLQRGSDPANIDPGFSDGPPTAPAVGRFR